LCVKRVIRILFVATFALWKVVTPPWFSNFNALRFGGNPINSVTVKTVLRLDCNPTKRTNKTNESGKCTFRNSVIPCRYNILSTGI